MQTTAPSRGSRSGRTSRDAPPSSLVVASPVRPQGDRPMTVEVMRAAVVAIRAGAFDDVGGFDIVGGGHSSSAAVVNKTCRPDADQIPWTGVDAGGRVVLTVAGHAGAGA